MNASPACIALIKQYEGLRLTVERDTNGVPVVGYGHDDAKMIVGDTITEAEAEMLLSSDVAKFESYLNRVISHPVTQGQFDALCDFTYNVGSQTLYKSKLLGLVNDGRIRAAADDLLNFCHDSSGKYLQNLYDRRTAEREMFLNG